MGEIKPRLPAKQLSILALARFAEPLAFSSVTPYLPSMVASFGVPPHKIAKWAGITSGSFAVTQCVTAVGWGRASDRYGRKPVVLLGLVLTMACFLIWGFSSSLAMAITVRALMGATNGNVGILRTIVAELVPQKELQPRAFSVMPLVWSVGSVVGPTFGGFLSEPAKQFPGVFGDSWLFTQFPYLLPNLVASVFFFVSFVSTLFFLEETLSTKREKSDWGILVGKKLTRAFRKRPQHIRHRRKSFTDGEATAPLLPHKIQKTKTPDDDDAAPPRWGDVFTGQTTMALIAYTFLTFHSVAFDQSLAVFLNADRIDAHTPGAVKLPFYFNGGFGLTLGEIGTIFTAYAITCGVVQFFVYPPLVTKLGVLNCFKWMAVVTPFVYFAAPFTALPASSSGRYAFLAVVVFFKAMGTIISFPSATIILTNSAASLRVLGTLNGIATTFSALGRAFGPALTGAVFSWGQNAGYIGAPYWFLALMALLGAVPSCLITEGDGPRTSPDSSPEASDVDDDGEESERTEAGGEDSAARLQGVVATDDADERGPLLGEERTQAGYDTVGKTGAV